MNILGIESSADETAAAVVKNGKKMLSNVVSSSLNKQRVYGGIVPEVAARNHLEVMPHVIGKALKEAFPDKSSKIKGKSGNQKSDPWDQIDGIAVTYGPGLVGCLLIGVMTARTLAVVKNKPLYAVNHVMAHPHVSFITEVASHFGSKHQAVSGKQENASPHAAYRVPLTAPSFPLLTLIVSGGHSQLVFFRDHFDYTLLGQTHDDAVGEAFDKVAKILGLPYPGGPSIERKAREGDPRKYPLPKAKMSGKYDFSFSGLKTAALRMAQAEIGEDYSFPSYQLSKRLTEAQKADLAASFQRIAIETLVDKTVQAYEEFQPKSVVVAGGVAASPELRRQIADRLPIPAIFPDMKLCTDNAAMIASLGFFMATKDRPQADPYKLGIEPGLSM
jgi:N6-L-threonylcarbamoyladenine synthase